MLVVNWRHLEQVLAEYVDRLDRAGSAIPTP
jgi:hypothetical protein